MPIFNNDTFPLRREVEYELTTAFRKELQLRTPLTLVDGQEADLVIYGTILDFSDRTVAEGRRDKKIESNVQAEVELLIEDYRSGSRRRETVRRTEPYSVELGETFEDGRRRAIANLAESMVTVVEYWAPRGGAATTAHEGPAAAEERP